MSHTVVMNAMELAAFRRRMERKRNNDSSSIISNKSNNRSISSNSSSSSSSNSSSCIDNTINRSSSNSPATHQRASLYLAVAATAAAAAAAANGGSINNDDNTSLPSLERACITTDGDAPTMSVFADAMEAVVTGGSIPKVSVSTTATTLRDAPMEVIAPSAATEAFASMVRGVAHMQPDAVSSPPPPPPPPSSSAPFATPIDAATVVVAAAVCATKMKQPSSRFSSSSSSVSSVDADNDRRTATQKQVTKKKAEKEQPKTKNDSIKSKKPTTSTQVHSSSSAKAAAAAAAAAALSSFGDGSVVYAITDAGIDMAYQQLKNIRLYVTDYAPDVRLALISVRDFSNLINKPHNKFFDRGTSTQWQLRGRMVVPVSASESVSSDAATAACSIVMPMMTLACVKQFMSLKKQMEIMPTEVYIGIVETLIPTMKQHCTNFSSYISSVRQTQKEIQTRKATAVKKAAHRITGRDRRNTKNVDNDDDDDNESEESDNNEDCEHDSIVGGGDGGGGGGDVSTEVETVAAAAAANVTIALQPKAVSTMMHRTAENVATSAAAAAAAAAAMYPPSTPTSSRMKFEMTGAAPTNDSGNSSSSSSSSSSSNHNNTASLVASGNTALSRAVQHLPPRPAASSIRHNMQSTNVFREFPKTLNLSPGAFMAYLDVRGVALGEAASEKPHFPPPHPDLSDEQFGIYLEKHALAK